ncbi:hypothetical protein DQ244_01615 [Blastococcus sp. TBT05-19]|uniref:hypothetical protein n=1 Tax=Blastococcus sp. TBT05-19 TaxID=2250581 RepID=UPI000DEA96F7|nr:hypothetical protein [Blastococcus sp. TBT05-19]RBY94085.1 hypothetical protein DQ244_01615 [Blastococcus sp. TBT05-19]
MTALEELCGRRAQETADGLLSVLSPLVTSPGGRARVPGVVVELLAALMEQAHVSEFGSAAGGAGSMDGVRETGSPADAGAAVGLSARRVRQLCEQGMVAHRRVGVRGYLVDIDDLRRYMRREDAA